MRYIVSTLYKIAERQAAAWRGVVLLARCAIWHKLEAFRMSISYQSYRDFLGTPLIVGGMANQLATSNSACYSPSVKCSNARPTKSLISSTLMSKNHNVLRIPKNPLTMSLTEQRLLWVGIQSHASLQKAMLQRELEHYTHRRV
jgi:hypothetical protein